MKTKLFIITGANGHLAGTIIRSLRNSSCLIRGLILPEDSGENSKQLTYYHGDVTKIQTMDEIFSNTDAYDTMVIHTAGMISIQDTLTSQLYCVNVLGTRNVIAQCMRHKVKRLLYISSVHAIPELEKSSTIQEVSSFFPHKVIGAYAKTKAAASQLVLDAAQKGLDTVIVHPSGIIGPFDQGNNHIVQFIQMYLSGKLPAGVTGGYDFVDVRDVAEGCLAALEKGQNGQCYILSNRYVTIRELLALMRQNTSGPPRICLPLNFVWLIAPIFEKTAQLTKTRPLFTRYSLYTLKSNGCFSHEKATHELDYHPREIALTVADTIAYLKGNTPPEPPVNN